jgi:hypothetical protein
MRKTGVVVVALIWLAVTSLFLPPMKLPRWMDDTLRPQHRSIPGGWFFFPFLRRAFACCLFAAVIGNKALPPPPNSNPCGSLRRRNAGGMNGILASHQPMYIVCSLQRNCSLFPHHGSIDSSLFSLSLSLSQAHLRKGKEEVEGGRDGGSVARCVYRTEHRVSPSNSSLISCCFLALSD